MIRYLYLKILANTMLTREKLEHGDGRYLELVLDPAWHPETWEARVLSAYSWYKVRHK